MRDTDGEIIPSAHFTKAHFLIISNIDVKVSVKITLPMFMLAEVRAAVGGF